MSVMEPVPTEGAQEVPEALAALERGELLLKYQGLANALISTSSLTVIVKSRRVGLTWGVASDAVLVAASAKGQGGMDVFYTSYSHDMTREFIDACAMWAKAFGIGLAEIGEFLFEDQDEHGNSKFIKAFRIDFASGFSIVALPSTPRSLRGRQGMVIIDEAAFVNDLAEVLKAALALLIWGGRVVVISTHNGIDNPFNQLLDEIRTGARKGATMRITLKDALDQGLYERICLMKGETPTPEGKLEFEAEIRGFYGEAGSEELDCVPSAGEGAWLSPGKIAACIDTDAGKPEHYAKGLTTVGRDVSAGRGGDLAVNHASEIVGPILWLRERWTARNASFREQDDEFDRMMRHYRVLRAGIDQTGMGEKVVEDAITRWGERVVGFLFTSAVKLDLAIALKKRFDDETIRIPDIPELRRDLLAIKKKRATGGAPQLVERGDVHPDEFWALAICCILADMGVVEIGFKSSGNTQGVLQNFAGAGADRVTDTGWGTISTGFDPEGML